MRRRVTMATVAASTVLAACGSTVQVSVPQPASQSLAVTEEAGDGTDAPGAASPTDTTPTTPGAAAGSGAGTGPVTAGSATQSGDAAGGDTSGGASQQSSNDEQSAGTGSTAAAADTTPVKLGFIVMKGGQEVTAGLGTEVSFGDGRLQAQAVVDEVNRTGGIGGRPIDPYYAEFDVTAPDSESNYNAACTKLTEDDEVFVVMTMINPPQSFIGCVANHETLLLNASFSPGDDFLYAEYPEWFFSPTLVSLDRGARLMMHSARDEGRLKGGPTSDVKVGVLYYDGDPQPGRVVEGVMEPLLNEWDVPYVKAGISGPEGVNGAQLQFAAAGVNLVMFQAPNGIAALLFMNSAENQGYRPDYYTTDPDSTRFVSENAPRNQARNIAGVGTLPISNVPVQSYPTTPKEEECLKLMREAGENDTDRLSSITATLYCELVWEFEAAGELVEGPMTYDKWRAAFRSLGTSYTPVSTFGMDTANGRNDNATLYRPYAWSDDCNCLAYTAKAKAIPFS